MTSTNKIFSSSGKTLQSERFQKLLNWFPLLVFICSIVCSLIYRGGEAEVKIIKSDALGYYQYLPEILLKGNIHQLPWAVKLENGNTLSLFHIGVSVLQLPFFLLAHLVALLLNLETSGYSSVYILGIRIAAGTYGALGIYFLQKSLNKMYHAALSFSVLICIFFGTNLFHYTAFDAGMSHVYSFFLFAVLIYLTPLFFQRPHWKYSAMMAVVAALIILIKPNNGIALLFPVLYFFSQKELRQTFWKKNYQLLVLLSGIFLLLLIPQLLYWKSITGDYIVFSYGAKKEGFNWLQPELWKVLFSHQNGWLMYHPMVIFALIGLVWGSLKKEKHFWVILIILLLAWYIFSSWWCWWFGAAYGHRAFIEYLSFLAFPFAYFLQQLKSWKVKLLFAGIALLLIQANLRMSTLYLKKLPWDGPNWTWSDYLEVIQKSLF